MNKSELKTEWLASSAVTAFVGSLLMAQALQLPAEERAVSFILRIPAVSDFVIYAIAVFLFVSSFALGLASVAPAIPSWTFRLISQFAPLMWLIVLTAFTMTLLFVYVEVRVEPFLQPAMLWGGFLMFLFISYRTIRSARSALLLLGRSKLKNDAECNDHGVAEPSKAPGQANANTPSQQGDSWGAWVTASAIIALLVIARIKTRQRSR